MAHKALMGGAVYEKYGGADLVGGTVYKKDYGKSVVGGTVYEVGFAQPVTITATNASWAVGNDADARKVEHNGVTYSEPTTFTANIGDIIVCTVGAKYGGYASIGVNGTSVVGQSVSGSTWEYFTYEYVVVSDAQMVLCFTTNRGQYSGSITITET